MMSDEQRREERVERVVREAGGGATPTDRPTHAGSWWCKLPNLDRPFRVHIRDVNAYRHYGGRWLPAEPPEFPPKEPEPVPCVCGGKPVKVVNGYGHAVHCSAAGICGMAAPYKKTPSEAIAAWNALVSAPQRVKEMEMDLDKCQRAFGTQLADAHNERDDAQDRIKELEEEVRKYRWCAERAEEMKSERPQEISENQWLTAQAVGLSQMLKELWSERTDLTAKVKELEEEARKYRWSAGDMGKRYADAEKRIKELENELDTTRANFDDADKTVAELEMDLDAARKRIQQLESDLEDLGTATGILGTDRDQLRDELARVKQAWPRRFKTIYGAPTTDGVQWKSGKVTLGGGLDCSAEVDAVCAEWIDDPPE